MKKKLFYKPDEILNCSDIVIGGKANDLLQMTLKGLPIPPWCVVPVSNCLSHSLGNKNNINLLNELYTSLTNDQYKSVIIRSSAEVEDSQEVSCAGLFESIVVDTKEKIVTSIEKVIDVSNSEKIRCYFDTHNISKPPSVAVIIQSYVSAKLAGILFSVHPSEGVPTQCYLEVIEQSTEGLADGSKEPTSFIIDLKSKQIISSKVGENGPSSIDSFHIQKLIDYLFIIEGIFGVLVDIEWAIDEEKILLLQARPITSFSFSKILLPSFCATSWFFDQRFSEPISTLTQTTLIPIILKHAIEEPIRMLNYQFSEDSTFYLNGQIYIAHECYKKLFEGVPKLFLTGDLRQLFVQNCYCSNENYKAKRNLVKLLRKFISFFFIALHRKNELLLNIISWNNFKVNLQKELNTIESVRDLSKESWLKRWNDLNEITSKFLRIHRWSIVLADYGYSIFKLFSRILPDFISQRLECKLHQPYTKTSEANLALKKLLSNVAGDKNELTKFIKDFGHRSESLDFAVPTWAELLETGELIEKYKTLSSESFERKDRRLRPWYLQPLIKLIEMREEQRFEWEKILAVQRKILIQAGDILLSRRQLDSGDDIWFLEWRELLAALFDDKLIKKNKITLRKHEYLFYCKAERPFFVGPYKGRFEINGTTFAGMGASKGIASGKIILIKDFTRRHFDLLKGKIIVMPSIDPAWTIILPFVKGLIIERGGLLSHGAILAREYSIPMIIGIEGITNKLVTGMYVTIDGEEGTLIIHNSKYMRKPEK